jgi:hypothetical protein
MITLPLGLIGLIPLSVLLKEGHFPFYVGWSTDHSNWEPESASYASYVEEGAWNTADLYIPRWSSVILGLAIFVIFGLTAESRASYSRILRRIAKLLGLSIKQANHNDSRISNIVFGERNLTRVSDIEEQR